MTPVESGRPVPLARPMLDGVPRLGVVNTGEITRAKFPVPLVPVTVTTPAAKSGTPVEAELFAPNPPLAVASNPVALFTGTLVAFVRLMLEGVPRLGVIRTGLVCKTPTEPEPVELAVQNTPEQLPIGGLTGTG